MPEEPEEESSRPEDAPSPRENDRAVGAEAPRTRQPPRQFLESSLGAETLERYESALERLEPREREAVVARLVHGHDDVEVARRQGFEDAESAREAVARAFARLAELMARGRG